MKQAVRRGAIGVAIAGGLTLLAGNQIQGGVLFFVGLCFLFGFLLAEPEPQDTLSAPQREICREEVALLVSLLRWMGAGLIVVGIVIALGADERSALRAPQNAGTPSAKKTRPPTYVNRRQPCEPVSSRCY